MRIIRISLLSILIITFFIFPSCRPPLQNKKKVKPAKNVILLIGDGMGLSQIYSSYVFNKGFLNIEKFKYIGLQKTYSASDFITDSGASGTAIACGKKTNNQMLGLAPDSSKLVSILKIAGKNGYSTGLVATSSIVHATPAAFIAHQPYRYLYENIALDFLNTDIDLFIGGGRKYFYKRKDSLNLMDSLTARNYKILYNVNDIDINKYNKVACFTAEDHNPKMSEGRGNYFPNAVEKAIGVLNKNKKGFFLMAEGSMIDFGCHANNQEFFVSEVVDFDNAVGKALEFAKKDGNTLVIVTADHETGGIGIVGGDINSGEVQVKFSSTDHTGVWVPVFAYGPGAENFIGIYENTDIFEKMLNAFGFKKE